MDAPACQMPWIHLHVSNEGYVKACCVANISFGNINDNTLDDIWNGDNIKKIRRQFLKGELDKRCAVCLSVEASGGKSIRQETFEKFKISDNYEINNTALPIYYDIRFSNVCNFKCRTCWHGASSKWFSDAKILGNERGEKAIIKNIRDLEDFLTKVGPGLKQAEEIYFAGGEPLVTEEHYLLLQWLIDNGNTKVRLRYNSNFSKLQFKQYHVLRFWQKFQNVEVMASIDAIGEHGELIRKEMIWEEILANHFSIKNLPHVKFKISPTVSVLNIFHLTELYKYGVENKLIQPMDFYFNMLERPYHYNLKAMPENLKSKARAHYKVFENWMDQNDIPVEIVKGFRDCISFMDAEDKSNYWEKFKQETKLLDEIRGETLNLMVGAQNLPKKLEDS